MSGTRLFFTICLLVSAVVIAALAADSLRPHAMTAEAAAGMEVWRAKQCEGCHTLYGQGRAYAPDLTGIYAQRGAAYLREFLVQPGAFHPGQRVMPAFGLTKTETEAVLAFLAWIGEQDTGWPPQPIRVSSGGSLRVEGGSAASAVSDHLPDDPVARGEYWFKRPPAICATCHALAPDVVIVGPSLAGIASRAATRVPGLDAEAYIRDSILNPGAYVVPGFPDAMMRDLGDKLSAEQINDILTFLLTLR
jgi:nitric oxide reductase subunit C